MDLSNLDFNILHFQQLPSTNIHAHQMIQKRELAEKSVIWTDYQDDGKGQRGSSWHTEPSKNLTFSLYIKPNLRLDKVFVLNKLVALAVVDLLDNLSVQNVMIKWPNDILVGKKKICGLLLENGIQSGRIAQSVIGIGLNVNQIDFPKFQREATSLQLELGKEHSIEKLLKMLLNYLQKRLLQAQMGSTEIERNYMDRFYGLNKQLRFTDGSSDFVAKVKGINQQAQLMLDVEGKTFAYSEKEVRFID